MSVQAEPHIPFPKGWNKHVRSSLLHVISLARFVTAHIRGWGPTASTHGSGRRPKMLRPTATIALDSNRSGSERKRWLNNRAEYSNEPSWRIRQNLQFSSERIRSMLRRIDTALTC